MKLKNLINEAVRIDSTFGEKMRYWVLKRKKQPDMFWLFNHLERILGADYVAKAAKEEIERVNSGVE